MRKPFLVLLVLSALLILSSCSDECRHSDIKETTFEPDCSSAGYTLVECLDCGYSFECDFLAPTGHDLEKSVVAPDCVETGHTEYFCDCGFSYLSDYTEPKGHTLSTKKIEPTCVDEGYTVYECDCGYSYRSDTTVPKGHVLSQETTAATCTEPGYTVHSCANCEESYTSDFVLPKGHVFRELLVRPTYISTGYTTYKCDCGFEYNGSFVMASDIYSGAFVEADAPFAKGIDLSKWNGEIDFSEFKKLGVDFVILKAGSTKSGIDPYFEANYASAKQAGLDVGAYFYTYSTTSAGALEDAKICIQILSTKQFEYPIYLDLEDPSLESLSREALTEICEVFIKEMQKNGYFCGLYINHNWLANKVHTEKVTTYFDVWYARWTVSGDSVWKDSFGEKTGLWQYTDAGTISGVSGRFDFNVAYKDYPALIKKYHLNGY